MLVSDIIRLSARFLTFRGKLKRNTLSKTENNVDQLYYKFLDNIIDCDATSRCTISNLLAVRYLERIADHAAYICESIVYLATGEKIILS